jgi:hypothetical protein
MNLIDERKESKVHKSQEEKPFGLMIASQGPLKDSHQ